jgi:hypothetical protein
MFFKRHGRSRSGWLTIAILSTGGVALAQDFAGVESAQSPNHNGKPRYLQAHYGFTTANNCVRATPHPPSIIGIDPDTRALLVPGEAVTQSGFGVMHFYKDGRLALDATATEVNLSQSAPGAFPQTAGLVGTCKGTYTLSNGNKVAVHFNCHVDITTQGVSFDLGPTNAEGFISENGMSINLNQKDDLQTVRLALPNGATLVSERTCVQRFALNKISE